MLTLISFPVRHPSGGCSIEEWTLFADSTVKLSDHHWYLQHSVWHQCCHNDPIHPKHQYLQTSNLYVRPGWASTSHPSGLMLKEALYY